ncbi:MAG: energy transducer TonB [Longimicrobiaceae bacterium]
MPTLSRSFAGVALLAAIFAAAAPARAQGAVRNEPDTQPALLTRNLPQLTNAAYPIHLRGHPIPGSADIRMKILENGRVDSASISVEKSSDSAFETPAIQVALKLRFRPATLGGEAVPVWVTYPIHFARWTDGTSTMTRRIPNPDR